MHEAAVPVLLAWENFYIILGSAAAALTGLMFIAITLISGLRRGNRGETIGAFSTPTVVHFCAALAIAAILSAPWQALWAASLPLGLAGLSGVIYSIVVIRRVLYQDGYQTVMEDWLWHIILPFSAYIALVVAAITLPLHPVATLFVIGTAAVLLVFIGVHNAWDGVTYLVVEILPAEQERQANRDERIAKSAEKPSRE